MADPVVKLAQPGFDARTTGDENLIYSSKWPLLKIYKQGSYTFTDANEQTITTHDLGFIPFFYWFSNENIEGWEGTGVARSIQSRAEFHGDIGNGIIKMDANKLFFHPNGPAVTGTFTIYYYIFALPLTEDYTAPQIKTGGLSSIGAGNQVLKIAKPNKDIKSPNLEDYIIHSDCRSPMLHMVRNGKLSGSGINTFTAPHGLGYKPLFFGFFKQTDGSYILLYGSSIIPGIVGFLIDEQKVQYLYPSTDTISIVVLKDPFDVNYSVRVSV